MQIIPYQEKEHQRAIYQMMCLESDWHTYINNFFDYKKALVADLVFICKNNSLICGFIRIKCDFSFGYYIMDLLVHKDYRNQGVGQALINYVKNNFSSPIYILSDVNEYYKKIGFQNIIGSVILI